MVVKYLYIRDGNLILEGSLDLHGNLLYFQEDGALYHYFFSSREWLNERYPDKRIGASGAGLNSFIFFFSFGNILNLLFK